MEKIEEGITLLHFAVQESHVSILQKLWVCAEECKLNPKEIKKKIVPNQKEERKYRVGISSNEWKL